MNRINFNRNIFLEKEELVNFQKFLMGTPMFKALLTATASFGLVTNNPSKFDADLPSAGIKVNDPFLVEKGSQTGTLKVNSGMAVDPSGNIINLESFVDNISIPSDGNYYWLAVKYVERNFEDGYVSINQKGAVTGTVDFSGKVRGQSGKTPVSIRFVKDDGSEPLNKSTYEIVQIVDSNNLILTSNITFEAETNLRVIVLGTLPLGKVFTDDQLNGLYTYSHYQFDMIREEETSVAPAKDDNQFFISRVKNASGVVTIDNSIQREYWTLANFISQNKG